MFVVKNKNIFFGISGLLVVLSLAAIVIWGLPLGIDFTGGSVVEVEYQDGPPTIQQIREQLAEKGFTTVSVRKLTSEYPYGFLVRTPFLSEDEHSIVVQGLSGDGEYELEEKRFSSVGPTIGAELRRKAVYAILFVVVLIVAYIAFAFRKVSDTSTSRHSSGQTSSAQGPSAWKYGIAAIVALIHDILIPTGVIVLLGQFGNATADTLFVIALLAILGLSVNDTIVVFDRIRENLSINKDKGTSEPFEQTVGRGLSQTYTRSINTSLTTLIVLLALFFIGGATIHSFVLTLIVGVIAGTYSSIFLASPLLVVMAKSKKK